MINISAILWSLWKVTDDSVKVLIADPVHHPSLSASPVSATLKRAIIFTPHILITNLAPAYLIASSNVVAASLHSYQPLYLFAPFRISIAGLICTSPSAKLNTNRLTLVYLHRTHLFASIFRLSRWSRELRLVRDKTDGLWYKGEKSGGLGIGRSRGGVVASVCVARNANMTRRRVGKAARKDPRVMMETIVLGDQGQTVKMKGNGCFPERGMTYRQGHGGDK